MGLNGSTTAQYTGTEVYLAGYSRRVASFIFDFALSYSLFLGILLLLYLIKKVQVILLLKAEYLSTAVPQSLNAYEVEFSLGFAVVFSLYLFFMLLAFNGTLGMKIANIALVRSDKNSLPHPLTIPQKFTRGFVSGLLGSLILFINFYILPFDKYRRSGNDIITGVFMIQKDEGNRKKVWLIWGAAIGMIIIFYLIASVAVYVVLGR